MPHDQLHRTGIVGFAGDMRLAVHEDHTALEHGTVVHEVAHVLLRHVVEEQQCRRGRGWQGLGAFTELEAEVVTLALLAK